MKRKVKVAQLGLGPIGLECLKLLATKSWVQIVGGIDIDPDKARKDLAELTGLKALRGIRVVQHIHELAGKPDLVFHTAVSRFPAAYEQIAPLVRNGINVVSSCEELIFPQLREPKLAGRLDRLCRQHDVRVVGTGVNPGFVMDLLPLCVSGVTRRVSAIHVERVVDASTRREPLQRKIGSGMPPKEFERLLHAGIAGHAGLKESLALILHCLGRKSDQITETGHAIVARRNVRTKYLSVRKGETSGLYQRAEASCRDGFRVTLDLTMCLDAAKPHDTIRIEGEPALEMVIQGGVAGDEATVAALVNTAPRLLRAAPGLRLITELAVA